MQKIKCSLGVMLLYASYLSIAQALATDYSLERGGSTEKHLLSYDLTTLIVEDSSLCESGASESCVLRRRGCSGLNSSVNRACPLYEKKRADSDACIKPSLNELTPQKTIHTLSFYTSISGRLSSQLLDFSKKIEQNYGYVVQPYPESSKSLSQGYVLNVEARLRLPNFFEHEVGELNLISFIETAAMTQSTSTWIDGMNPSAFTGAGLGILLSYESHHEVKAYLVHKTGNEVAVSAQSSSNKIAIQARKYF